MTLHYDVLLLGIGHRTPALAGRLNDLGLQVAMVRPGPQRARDGEVDSETTRALVASARTLFVARRAAQFGIVIPEPMRADFAQVTARLSGLQEQAERCGSTWISRMQNVDFYEGPASFLKPGTVDVNGQRLIAQRIYLDLPQHWALPDVPGVSDVDVLRPGDLLQLPGLPEHLVIFGGSHTALEFAQIFRRFGSQVTLIAPESRLLSEEDPDTAFALKQVLESEGVRIRLNAKGIAFERAPEGIAVRSNCCGDSRTVIGSHLMIAAECTPQTEGLGLERIGIQTDARGRIPVDDQLRTTAAGVWALGACNGRGGSSHATSNDHEIVAEDLGPQEPRTQADPIPCSALFSDPPLGRVGLTEAEARRSGRRVLVGKWPMSNASRARAEAEPHGFIKVLVDGDTQELVGATVLGVHGDEVVHQFLPAMVARTPFSSLAHSAHIQSTVSALLPSTFRHLVPLESSL